MELIASLLRFNVYYTTRRVLYELGATLRNGVHFDLKKYSYSLTSLTRLISYFKTSVEDFRFKGGANQGLGSVHIYDDHGRSFIADYMPYVQGSGDFSYVFFMRLPEKLTKNPATYFIPSTSRGMTRAGALRTNQSLEV